MPLTDLVAPNAIVPALKVNGKKQAIQELSARAAKLTGQSERLIFETLTQREKLGSTGVGNGIAIPHGKLPKLEKLVGLFARLERGDRFRVARRPAGRSDFPAARPGRRGRRSSQGACPRRAAVARGRGGNAAARDARCRRALRDPGAALVGSCRLTTSDPDLQGGLRRASAEPATMWCLIRVGLLRLAHLRLDIAACSGESPRQEKLREVRDAPLSANWSCQHCYC